MTFAPHELEAALARVEAVGDAQSREAARDAIGVVLEFHRQGLQHLLGALPQTARVEVLRSAAKDELLAGLFALHDLDSSVRPDVPLERLTQGRTGQHERCELCAQPLSRRHEHLFDVERRQLRCACTACSVLFDTSGSALKRVRRVAEKVENLQISEVQWSALHIPVGLAFISYSSVLRNVVAAYPGLAGAMESVVPASAWEEILSENPALAGIEPDVGALLVNRLGPKPMYYVLSIDQCYRLTGLVRARWEGLTGGGGALRAVTEFMAELPGAHE